MKNKYVPVGMMFLVVAIVLQNVSNVSAFVQGIVYGIAIGVFLLGIINCKKVDSI